MSAPWALSHEEECGVMTFDPWGERDATYRTLRSQFVNVRTEHRCDICFGTIKTHDRVWAKTEVDYGKAKTFRFCSECCWCIAHRHDQTDDDPSFGFVRLDERWDIGYRRSRQEEIAKAQS